MNSMNQGHPGAQEFAIAISPVLAEVQRLRLSEVSSLVKFGKTKIYKMMRLGQFPQPVRHGGAARWRLSDIQEWARKSGGAA